MKAAELLAVFLWGVVLGLAYLALLWRSVQAHLGQGSGAALIGLGSLRLGLVAGGLVLSARLGAPGLLVTLAGFLVARTLVTRRVRGGIA